MNIDDIKTQFADLRKQVQEGFNAKLLEALQPLFDKYPKLESLSFTVYTPYFNDGEECTYQVNSDYPELNGTDEWDEEMPVEIERGSYEDRSAWRATQWQTQATEEFTEIVGSIPDEIFQMAWDNHVKATITRNEITFEEYEHE